MINPKEWSELKVGDEVSYSRSRKTAKEIKKIRFGATGAKYIGLPTRRGKIIFLAPGFASRLYLVTPEDRAAAKTAREVVEEMAEKKGPRQDPESLADQIKQSLDLNLPDNLEVAEATLVVKIVNKKSFQ